MFCSKCGKELKEGVQYCPNCGTFNGSKANNSSNASSPANELLSDVKGKINTGLSSLGSRKLLYVVNLGLYILSLLLFMLPFGSISMMGYTQSYSIFDSAEYSLPLLLPYIAGAVLMVLPLLRNKPLRGSHFLVAKIAEIIGCIIAIVMTDNVPKMAFGGVCVMIFLPIAIITTFLISYDIKIERLTELVTEKVMKQLRKNNNY